jgi:signal transduction histidine kinase
MPYALFLPLLFSFISTLAVFGSFGWMPFLMFIFSLAFLWQWLLVRKRSRDVVDKEIFLKISKDADTSAKMLIRRDIELTRKNEKLLEINEVKSNFVSVASHQMRTPLSGLKWLLHMFLTGDLGPITDEQKVFLSKGYESTNRMVALVNDMLEADRFDSGVLEYEFTQVEITELIDGVLYEFLPKMKEKKLRLMLHYPEKSLPKVSVDKKKMWAVLQNLLENSIKYTPNGGNIEITVAEENKKIKVSIHDDGIGIPKDQQKHIFSRFFRAKNAVKTETDGSGLGLYIAKSILERRGGEIWFEDTGIGSTFHFTIPLAAP